MASSSLFWWNPIIVSTGIRVPKPNLPLGCTLHSSHSEHITVLTLEATTICFSFPKDLLQLPLTGQVVMYVCEVCRCAFLFAQWFPAQKRASITNNSKKPANLAWIKLKWLLR